MKYGTLDRFLAEYGRLNHRERRLFLAAVALLNRAYRAAGGAWPPSWPAALRIRPLSSHPGIFELTWSFAGPDGRATFEFIEIDGEPAIRWRRIGGHEIFRQP